MPTSPVFNAADYSEPVDLGPSANNVGSGNSKSLSTAHALVILFAVALAALWLLGGVSFRTANLG